MFLDLSDILILKFTLLTFGSFVAEDRKSFLLSSFTY